MAEISGIAWCHHSTNFWQGCTKVGPGCDGCYAAARDTRLHAGEHWGPGAPRAPRLENAARDLRQWNRKAQAAGERRRVFIDCLSDFFDNEAPQAWRDFAWQVFRECSWLDILIVTKRIGNAWTGMLPLDFNARNYPNVWIGITVVNQAELARDWPKLAAMNAAVRFLSMEPLLERTDLCETLGMWWNQTMGAWEGVGSKFNPDGLDWVIVGGESKQVGHVPRPFHVEWVRSILEVCRVAGVPVFVKQLGARPRYFLPGGQGPHDIWLGDKRAGANPAEWAEDLRVQEFPA